MSGSIAGFNFVRLDHTGGQHVPPNVYGEQTEILERIGLDGQDIRLTGERGAEFEMESLALAPSAAAGVQLLIDYKQAQGSGKLSLTWNGIDYDAKQTRFHLLNLVPLGNDPGANAVYLGAAIGNQWLVRARWTLLPVRP